MKLKMMWKMPALVCFCKLKPDASFNNAPAEKCFNVQMRLSPLKMLKKLLRNVICVHGGIFHIQSALLDRGDDDGSDGGGG